MKDKNIKKIVEKAIVDNRRKIQKEFKDSLATFIIYIPVLCLNVISAVIPLIILFRIFETTLIREPMFLLVILCSSLVLGMTFSNWVGEKWFKMWKEDD